MEFNGIKGEGMFLLAQNRFENSKEFYDSNKSDIKRLVIDPVKQLATIIGEDMFKYDPQMELDPNKMISRIRRDTRYSKNKELYRENVWLMFMRNKHVDSLVPCFWFEIFQDRYNCGVTFFDANAAIYERYRQNILEYPSVFRRAVKSCQSSGCVVLGNPYKKLRENSELVPKDLLDFYNMRNLGFMKTFYDMKSLENGECIQLLKDIYKKMNPYYQFLLNVYEEYKQNL